MIKEEEAAAVTSSYSYFDSTKKTTLYYKCEICLGDIDSERKNCYGTKICHHCVCQECMQNYLNQILRDSSYKDYSSIWCPGGEEGCHEKFDTNKLVNEVYLKEEEKVNQWWHDALRSKAYIKNKVRCPREDCHAVFDVEEKLLYQCTFTECMSCYRGFCITCESPWHPGIMKVVNNKEAMQKTLNVAKESYWCRCPTCHLIVEREGGCAHIYCVCGTEFCYHCGRDTDICMDECEFWTMEKLDKYRKGMFDYHEEEA